MRSPPIIWKAPYNGGYLLPGGGKAQTQRPYTPISDISVVMKRLFKVHQGLAKGRVPMPTTRNLIDVVPLNLRAPGPLIPEGTQGGIPPI